MQKILISISIILIIIGIVIVTKKQKNSKNSEVLYIYTVKNGHVRMKKRYLKARTMNDILNSVHYMFDYISSCQERNYIMIDNQPYIFNDKFIEKSFLTSKEIAMYPYWKELEKLLKDARRKFFFSKNYSLDYNHNQDVYHHFVDMRNRVNEETQKIEKKFMEKEMKKYS
jgi:hypothetical protein